MFCNLSYKHHQKIKPQTTEGQELFLAGFLAGTCQDFLHITYCEFIFIRIEEIVQVGVGHHQVGLVEQAGGGRARVGSQALGICGESTAQLPLLCMETALESSATAGKGNRGVTGTWFTSSILHRGEGPSRLDFIANICLQGATKKCSKQTEGEYKP